MHLKEEIMRERVEEALELVRGYLQADGGDVEVVDVTDGVVQVRLNGACGGCPASTRTLKYVIEQVLKDKLHDEVKRVVAVP